jgi:hypothetical protein
MLNNYPLVTIIITTYDPGDNSRFNLLFRTIDALKTNLDYPNLAWVIADDGSEHFPAETLFTMLDGYPRTFTNANRKGVGKSKNIALQHAFTHSPYVLLLEDDWVLKEPLDLIPPVEVLRDNYNVGMIRYGFLGGGMEAIYTDYGLTKTYWTLKHKSGHYVYSGQVSLRHKRFYDSLGMHAERDEKGKPIAAGVEEDELCHRYNDAMNVPDILWPAHLGCTLNAGAFVNIGLDSSVNAVVPVQ